MLSCLTIPQVKLRGITTREDVVQLEALEKMAVANLTQSKRDKMGIVPVVDDYFLLQKEYHSNQA
jgi:hypothetical protein